jgi:hypothetical protein
MNVAIKLKNMVSRAALVGMVSLITGSTNGIAWALPAPWLHSRRAFRFPRLWSLLQLPGSHCQSMAAGPRIEN